MQKLKIPYSFLPPELLIKITPPFYGFGEILSLVFPQLKLRLKQANMSIGIREYLSICFISSIFNLVIAFIFSYPLLSMYVKNSFSVSFLISIIFFMFTFIQQLMYPMLVANRKIKGIEKNLVSTLQNMLVQLNSGVPLFNIIVNIADGDFGEISNEFKKVVKEINTGRPAVDALADVAAYNPSIFFRRAIWQIVNGMKAGSDLSTVLKEIINSLSEEQVIQIQKYGGQLNPIAMFYMLVAVIIPSLGMTFLIIISSFVSLTEYAVQIVFWGFFAFAVFMQIMFMGVIRTKRPNLLGD